MVVKSQDPVKSKNPSLYNTTPATLPLLAVTVPETCISSPFSLRSLNSAIVEPVKFHLRETVPGLIFVP